MADISVIILTHNEEIHLARALESIRSFAKFVYVVDSYSTDRTAAIAKQMGAIVLYNKWVNYSKQFQWALDNANITTEWIMRLDADEIIEPPLAKEILDRLPGFGRDVVGVNLKRKHIFLGRWVRFGGRYPLILTRLWRKSHGRIEDRWMDEHIVVSGGRTVTFINPFSDHNLNDLGFFTEKHNKYATREAVDALNQRYNLFPRDSELSSNSNSLQASIKRVFKEKIYNRIPFQVAAFAYFLYRYLFQLGFLDGRSGLIYHFLQGGWYRFLVGAKIYELDKSLRDIRSTEERKATLARLTGLSL